MVGDFFRVLVARTQAQQWGSAAEPATAPYQFALFIAHVAQALTYGRQCHVAVSRRDKRFTWRHDG